MLTNNKKNFVRSIAMLLALLMVTALCLTGCGNKTADEALAKAEEAKTVADEVKAALAGYLTTADAEAKVSALVDAALADGVATKAELDALAAKLDSYVTADDVAGLIKDAVAEAALEGAMTKEDVLKILEDYYTAEEVDAKFEAYFGELAPETVLVMLQDAEKAMNKKDWNAATDLVLETIADMQVLLESLNNGTYTQANMVAVNKALEPVGLVAFVDANNDDKLEVTAKLATGEFAKMLEYAILRVADVEEMDALKDAVAEAVAVPTFESAFEALVADLYDLGELVVLGAYNADDEFEAIAYKSRFGASTTPFYYHGVAYAGTDDLVAQVVTLDDKAAYQDIILAYDALLVEYNLDGAYATGKAGWQTLPVKYVFRTVSNGVGTVTLVDPANAESASGTKVGATVVTEAAYLDDVFNGGLKASELLVSPLFASVPATTFVGYTNDYKANNTYVDMASTDATDKYILVDQFDANKSDVFVSDWVDSYNTVVARLTKLQAKANALNAKFAAEANTSFLNGTVWANSALVTEDYEDITDAEFLGALTAAMCEPNGVNVYTTYLEDITVLVNNFRILNAQSNTGFNKLALYEDMISKAYDLLWDKYLAKAFADAEIILNDYLSVLYMAADQGKVNTEITATYSATQAAALMTGESVTAADLTDGFLNAFLNGDKVGTTEYLDGTIYDKVGHSFNKLNVNWMLKGNDAIKTITGSTGAPFAKFTANSSKTVGEGNTGYNTDLTAVPFAALLGENKAILASRLAGAMTYTSTQIIAANKDAMKASGVPVQDAFNDILLEAMTNLDEIYMRAFTPAYKNATLNYLYAYATTITNFYATAGVNTTVTKAMEQYLTGYAYTKTDASHTWANQVGASVSWNKDGNGNNTTIKSISYTENSVTKSYAGASLKNNQVKTALDGVSASLYATSDSTGTAPVGAEAWAKVDKIAAEAIDVMENVIVANQFYFYIQQARQDWAAVNTAYFNNADKTDYELLVALSLQNTSVTDTLNNIEFYARYDMYDLSEYKTHYLEILEIIVAKNNKHLGLLANSIETILNAPTAAAKATNETYVEMLSAVKSAWGIPDDKSEGWVTDKAAIVPATLIAGGTGTAVDPYQLTYVGTSVAGIDEILNAEAAYYTEDYKSIVNLY